MTDKEKTFRLVRFAVFFPFATVLAFFIVALIALTSARAENVSIFTKQLLFDATLAAPSLAKTDPNKEYTITRDTGGVIGLYLAHYEWLEHTHIIVDGLCNSACTLVLANEDVCATDKAYFGFHLASNAAGTAILIPAHVKAWIAAHGGLTSKVIFARGYELLPKCKP